MATIYTILEGIGLLTVLFLGFIYINYKFDILDHFDEDLGV